MLKSLASSAALFLSAPSQYSLSSELQEKLREKGHPALMHALCRFLAKIHGLKCFQVGPTLYIKPHMVKFLLKDNFFLGKRYVCWVK